MRSPVLLIAGIIWSMVLIFVLIVGPIWAIVTNEEGWKVAAVLWGVCFFMTWLWPYKKF